MGALVRLLLAFQLALGGYGPAAQASMPAPASGSAHCSHQAMPATTPVTPSLHTEPEGAGASQHQVPLHKHGCCGSMSCQCQGASTPISADVAILAHPIGPNLLIQAVPTLSPAWRIDEPLRPPIL